MNKRKLTIGEQYKFHAETAFQAAGLTEVKETDLEPGTYTNAQIIAGMKGKIDDLRRLLLELKENRENVQKRRKELAQAFDAYVQKRDAVGV